EIVEDEHRDAPRLPVAGRGETQIRRGVGRGRPQLLDNCPKLARRARAEESERDVQVSPRDDPDTAQVRSLPGLERIEDALGEAQREEEAQPLIALHAIRRSHTELSGL